MTLIIIQESMKKNTSHTKPPSLTKAVRSAKEQNLAFQPYHAQLHDWRNCNIGQNVVVSPEVVLGAM
jgi:UDP-3-O-[3-hydroxymyristoyl] glucosamine N-acyltransferase